MAIKVNIKELTSIDSPSNDHYSVTATLQLIEDDVVIAEKPVSVTGYILEDVTVKKAVKSKLKAAGLEWKERLLKTRQLVKDLTGLGEEQNI